MISCKDKVICPAYQSSYILDPSQRDQFFYPFTAELNPKKGPFRIKKDKKTGLLEQVTYTKRTKEIRTIPMHNLIMTELTEEDQLLLLAEVEDVGLDSLGLDSASLYTNSRVKKGVKYNMDQHWYEHNIEEITEQDGIDPKTIFSKKKVKAEEVKPPVDPELSEEELLTDDPLDFEFENEQDDDIGGVGFDDEPVIEEKKKDDTDDDGLDDF